MNFNSHAHVERDCHGFTDNVLLSDFNSHAHVERDMQGLNAPAYLFHFNSHAHVERDIALYNLVVDLKISTHTLTWSVTALESLCLRRYSFQLTRSRGA